MIVLDASVAIKWFLIEAETPRALTVAQDILRGQHLYCVPELFYFEVFAVLARKHANPRLWADQGMRWLLNLPLKRMSMTREWAQRMQGFASQGLTGYDAAYAALAHPHGGKWLTFDVQAKAQLGSPHWIVAP